MNQRFRAVYLAAVVVFCIGLLGFVVVPRAHADTFGKHLVPDSLHPVQKRIAESSKPLAGFATLGVLSSFSLALLYSKGRP